VPPHRCSDPGGSRSPISDWTKASHSSQRDGACIASRSQFDRKGENGFAVVSNDSPLEYVHQIKVNSCLTLLKPPRYWAGMAITDFAVPPGLSLVSIGMVYSKRSHRSAQNGSGSTLWGMAWRKRRRGRRACRLLRRPMTAAKRFAPTFRVCHRAKLHATNEDEQEDQTPIDVRQWHVLYTRHQHEKPVARILSSKGHEVFLPLYAVTHGGKTGASNSVYRCFRVTSSSGRMDSNSKSSVRRSIYHREMGRPPCDSSRRQIEGIRQMVESTFRIEPFPYLTSGDRVRVRSGRCRAWKNSSSKKESN